MSESQQRDSWLFVMPFQEQANLSVLRYDDTDKHDCQDPPENDNRTVWSSEHGGLRKKKDLTAGPSLIRKGRFLPPQQQTVYLHRESSGRRGKAVTLLKNLVLATDDLKALSKKLKQECGTGGTIKDGVIEIQGDQRGKIAHIMRRLGYKVKLAGG